MAQTSVDSAATAVTASGSGWSNSGNVVGNIQGSSKRWKVKVTLDYDNDNCTVKVTGTDGTWGNDDGVIQKTFALKAVSYTHLDVYKRQRWKSVMKLDNILVRTTDKYDEFGKKAEETLSKIEFTSELNTTINQPAEDTPVHKPIAIKATGIYGGDLTNKEGLNVEWTVTGLDNEDGYISLTKESGSGTGTDLSLIHIYIIFAHFNFIYS